MVIRGVVFLPSGVEVTLEVDVIDWEDELLLVQQVKDLGERIELLQGALEAGALSSGGGSNAEDFAPSDAC